MMNKNIKLVILFFTLSTAIHAQIKRPNVSINTDKVKTDKQFPKVKIELSKLKNASDFKKLNIPVSQISKEKLNAKSTNTWRITPLKPKDGLLELKSLFGIVTKSNWQTGIEVKNHNSRFTDFNPNFPLSIKFRVSKGVEYRLKLRDLMKNRYGYVYIAIRDVSGRHAFINRVEFDRNNELYYTFYEENSKDIVIDVSFISTNSSGNQINYECLKLSEIEISKILKTQ